MSAPSWLDLVRYAETFGHEFDFDLPNAFRYRDYVIRAFNDDLPYDQFVVEHVAGDLLDPPRRDRQTGVNESLIATGWFFFGEAKHSPVDVRQDEADRVDNQIDVFAKTFLGLTVSCARCHDHKFDAISTKDYYALAGYLQSSRYQQAFIDPPESLAPAIGSLNEVRSARERACVEFARANILPRIGQLGAALLAQQDSPSVAEWSKLLDESARPHVDDPFHVWAVLTEKQPTVALQSFIQRRDALARLLKEQLITDASSTSVIFDFSSGRFGDWRLTGPAFGDRPGEPLQWAFGKSSSRFPVDLLTTSAAHSGLISPRLRGVLRSPTFEITRPKIFYRLYGTGGQVRLVVDGLQLIQNPIYGGLKFEAGGPAPHWHEQDVSKWIGHRAYFELVDDGDGVIALENVVFADSPPLVKPNRLTLEMLDDLQLTSLAVLAEKYQSLAGRVLMEWLADPTAPRENAGDRAALIHSIIENPLLNGQSLDTAQAAFRAEITALDAKQQQIEKSIPAPNFAPAIADGTAENEHVFIRGSHKTPGDEVPRRFLEVLGGTRHAPPAAGSGRLELARQMVAPANPLVPRVMVNRIWQHHFGEGLVRTSDDFGVMGQPPTHPALLDFLAGEFVRQRWSIKKMHRMMVLSSTYRMSSQLQPGADRVDPQNKLWHRMSVRRLEAETIRDAILAISGSADPTMYGPGVMPYLTEYMTGRGRPTTSGPLDGAGRRSVYLAVRRNFLPPMFLAFDYPIPFTTIGRRSTSNVPAQALVMLNNPLMLQQAEHWATRVLSEPDRSAVERISAMYESSLGRPPDDAERQAALAFLQSPDVATDGARQAWTDLAHVLFNVKEFIFIP